MPPNDDAPEPVRRDFLSLVTIATAGLGACAFSWPFLDSLGRPAARDDADAAVDVDLNTLSPGGQMVVAWRGMPVFVVRRTAAELHRLQQIEPQLLRDPDSTERQQPAYATNWHRSIAPEFGVMVGICTHLGCVPRFRPDAEPASGSTDRPGGYACPCHGSRFDLAGRVFVGAPAQYNLPVPPYRLATPSRLRIGVNPDGAPFDFGEIRKI